MSDPLNLIKKCPNPECGLVWIKVFGCDGETYCGHRLSAKEELECKVKTYGKYLFKKVGDTF